MKCYFCDNLEINEERYGSIRCKKCKALHFLNSYCNSIREVVFFVNFEDCSYRIHNDFDENKTIIYKIFLDGKYVKIKSIFTVNLFNLNPNNAAAFIKNKLKMYQLFS